ncbi:MAG: DUF502 domain-containing protein [Halobacteriaceae archaeon]
MGTADSPEEGTESTAQRRLYGSARSALLTGVAVVVPILITLYVLNVAVDILTQVLQPFVTGLVSLNLTGQESQLFAQVIAVVLLGAITFLIGVVANFQTGQRAISYFDLLVERLPGIGGVYKSFRKMSDVLLESDTENFQSVVLVEFPSMESYTLGFETTQTPDEIEDAAGAEEMVTLFLPLAPNPVMGGHLAHIPSDRVMEVDMTVEEGMRTIVTTGVAATEGDTGLTSHEMAQLGAAGIGERDVSRDRKTE